MSDQPPSKRATVKRAPKQGVYDRAAIDAILDQGLICHVGFSIDRETFVIPTIHVRVGDKVCLHGSRASRMMQALAGGADACLAVTIVDGLVLARSIFHHSMNYRSVVLFGKALIVEDDADKVAVLRALSEHLIPGRWADVRGPSEQELRQTMVLAVPIHEASAKVRSGPPKDDEVDYALPFWAGVIPLRLTPAEPVGDPRLRPGIEPPAYAVNYPGPR
jgi:nitroimidazol reductase NimA-like FMN-containing flavoprotein (pyridoxamine 5'-phosphate oxidase superfamily)